MEPIFKNLMPANKQAPIQTNTGIPMFLGKLFGFRDKLHLLHLSTTSFAEHKALDEAYTGVLDLADSITESVQGIYGLQKIKVIQCEEYSSAVETVQYMYGCISENRSLFKETWIHNIMDEFQHLFATTLYKLRFLN